MLKELIQALYATADPLYLLMLSLGVVIGLVVGVLPGVGGTVAMAVVLPFIYPLDPINAFALLIGAGAVCVTSDTITCVLFGVPGTVGSMATIVDGYALAKKGEAGRALGAAFSASLVGGVIGAVCLTASLPLARPLILLMGSPEFFMLSLLGIIMVATLGGKSPIKGFIGSGIGMILSTIGGVPGVGEFRYTFGEPYLFNGLNLVVVALGIFALPEIVDMLTRGTQISEVPELGKGIIEGIKDVWNNMTLVLKCSAIGAYIGFIPGLGQAVANWFAYSYVVNSSKNRENFGKGDIRGVIAPESANNASAGGALIPSVLFGIPGSGMMAILLAGFLILGIYPGRDMVTTHLNITFSMVWSLTLANILACALCMMFVKPLAKVTVIKIHYIAPFILMIVILGAFQCTRHWGDLIAILLLSVLGWFMKQFGWARPPLLVGFILGGIAERYFYLSTMRYGAGWLIQPGVIIIACLIVLSVYMALRWRESEQTGNK